MWMDGIDFSELPPGFGFHPTDVELISHYLKRKIMGVKDELDVIPVLDIYKYEPWDLPAKSGIPSRECKWHFFNVRDRKYPNGSRSNRATGKGYWKSTGKDRTIQSRNRNVGTKKTLVFHEGRPPMGKRTDWIMHEYYLDEKEYTSAGIPKGIFVLCRVTKRNGFPSSEECFPVEDSNNSSTPCFHENSQEKLGGVPEIKIEKEESPSLIEVKDQVKDYDDWFEELYDDPDFPVFPSGNDTGSKLDLDTLFIPPMLGEEESLLMGQDFPLEGQNFYDSSCGWSELQAMDFHALLPNPPENAASPIPVGLLESHDDARSTHEKVDEANASDGTGIIIRRRAPGDFTGVPGQKIRLQVHKMQARNPGVSNHMVILDGTSHRLDSDDSFDVWSAFKRSNGCQLSEEVYEPRIDNACVETYGEIGIAPPEKPSMGMEGGCAYSKCCRKDGRAWKGMKRSMNGVLKEARSLVRRCSSFGPSCLFVGTCLVGAAAMTACFHEEDS